MDMDTITYVIEDVQTAKYFIISSAFLALMIGFVWMVVLKLCMSLLVWTAIFLVYVILTALTYLVYDMGV